LKRGEPDTVSMSTEPEVAPGTDETDALSCADALGDAIKDLPAYERFLETKRAVEQSEQAQEKVREFEQARSEFMLSRQSGNASQEDLRELQAKQAELNEVPEMAEHLQAKNQLEVKLAELNDAISRSLAIDFGQEAGGCCED
jgi:cell fate (sporulation/competence/biofilm development) regulator YlbF (YheA/YmcA/DUF963 family)